MCVIKILFLKEFLLVSFQKKQKLDNSNESIDDENIQDLDASKYNYKEESEPNINNNESTQSNLKEDDNATKMEQRSKDLVAASTVAEGNQKTTKSAIESSNDGNGHNEHHNMDYNKTYNESHTGNNDICEKLNENHGESTTYSVSHDKLDQNKYKNNNEVKKIETEDFNSNNVKTNIPDNEQCDICGQYVYDSDIIYYQGHPQDAVEEFIALTNEKLVLSAGNYQMPSLCR